MHEGYEISSVCSVFCEALCHCLSAEFLKLEMYGKAHHIARLA